MAIGAVSELEEHAVERRAADLGDRFGGRQLGVALDKPRLADQAGKEGMVGEIEEHAEAADERSHGIELRHGERAQGERDGDRRQDQGAQEVGDDHHAPPPPPVDEAAAEPADQDRRTARQGGEVADLGRAGPETGDRGERQALAGDPRPERGDRLRRPEAEELAMLPETQRSPLPRLIRTSAPPEARPWGAPVPEAVRPACQGG